MIITLGKEDNTYNIVRRDPDNETELRIDGLSFEEAINKIKEWKD